jgi:glycosyltransferase involved in cell wall biosynthesis
VAIEATIVGNGPAKADWEALAAARGLGDRVRFTGRADWDEIPELIAGFDLGFSGQQPSRSDPRVYFSPIKLYEYMAMARPVIASATEDARALLAADNVGYLYEVGDIDGLRNALQRAWEERASLRERGQLARQMIVREHTWDQRVKLLESRMTPLLAEQYARFR